MRRRSPSRRASRVMVAMSLCACDLIIVSSPRSTMATAEPCVGLSSGASFELRITHRLRSPRPRGNRTQGG